MKVKNVKLEWNVLRHDWNKNAIINFNIFGTMFIEKLHKEVLKKEIKSMSDLKDFIDSWARYHYWSKAEHEIIVSGLSERDIEEKIDIYRQISMNLDRITEYVANELKVFKKEEE